MEVAHYILIRKCGEYYSGNIVLGIYTNIDLAKLAKVEYIEKMKIHDPHFNQTYHHVNLQEDVKVRKINVVKKEPSSFSLIVGNNNNTIYFLIDSVEGFGQVFYEFIYFSTNMVSVYAKYQELIKVEREWPSEFYWDSVTLNTLRDNNNVKNLENYVLPKMK